MKPDWFKEWFESADYLKVYKHRDFHDAEKLTATLLEKIKLRKNSFVLDAACGNGRYSVLLSQMGFRVVGFDLSRNLLAVAQEHAKQKKCDILLFRADLRKVCLKKKFDLILLAFTSFGYFENDEENLEFIRTSFNLLKIKGYFVLDFFNERFVRNNLVRYSEKKVDKLRIEERRKIESNSVVKTITIDNGKDKRTYFEKVKLYGKDFIVKQMGLIGYKIVDIFGNYEGGEFDPELSERLIIIGRK